MPFSNQNPCTHTMKRNNLDIEADILEVARQGTIKTHLVYGANLNFNIVKKYIERLLTKGCLRQEGPLYYTTEKGFEYMNLIDACTGFQ